MLPWERMGYVGLRADEEGGGQNSLRLFPNTVVEGLRLLSQPTEALSHGDFLELDRSCLWQQGESSEVDRKEAKMDNTL